MTLRRFNREVKSRAAKGKPGSPMRHLTVRYKQTDWKKYEFHFTKGYRRPLEAK